METGRRASAISAGALALALGGLPVVGAAPAQAAVPGLGTARAPACEKSGGLLSGLTGGICDIVNDVTDVVDELTGSSLNPVTGTVTDTTTNVLNGVGGAPQAPPAPALPAPEPPGKPGPAPSARPAPTDGARPGEDGAPAARDTHCRAGRVCESADSAAAQNGPEAPPPPARPRPPRERPERRAHKPAPKTHAPYIPERRVHSYGSSPIDGAATGPGKPRKGTSVDVDRMGVTLMWHPDILSTPLGPGLVRPRARQSDALGTTLTMALLLSAIIATRFVYAKRRGGRESIPFEPLRPGGQHRLA
ncbi:hypothetical protein [Sinosporangium siamense]|uniref:Uncharacterized protein n=1 Tax=Sinosporangium siamense TaxID=1367973 RepID=A0A919V6A0_9ACTN|nr:hypothetical protein [Sinosporangium siamense]GII93840.1 hypothetical protein Ssi02_40710 [Sinosporangium siamense]